MLAQALLELRGWRHAHTQQERPRHVRAGISVQGSVSCFLKHLGMRCNVMRRNSMTRNSVCQRGVWRLPVCALAALARAELRVQAARACRPPQRADHHRGTHPLSSVVLLVRPNYYSTHTRVLFLGVSHSPDTRPRHPHTSRTLAHSHTTAQLTTYHYREARYMRSII